MTSYPSATAVLGVFVRAFQTPDLRKRLLFTGAMIVLFRFGSNLPAPGISEQNVSYCSRLSNSSGVFAIVNLLSGNSLLHLSVRRQPADHGRRRAGHRQADPEPARAALLPGFPALAKFAGTWCRAPALNMP